MAAVERIQQQRHEVMANHTRFVEAVHNQLVSAALNDVVTLDMYKQIVTPKNRQTSSAVSVLVMCDLLDCVERVLTEYNGVKSRAEYEEVVDHLQVLLSMVNSVGQRRDSTLEQAPVTAAVHVLASIRELISNFSALASSEDVARAVQSADSADVEAATRLRQLAEGAQSRLATIERISTDMAKHNQFVATYQDKISDLGLRLRRDMQMLEAL